MRHPLLDATPAVHTGAVIRVQVRLFFLKKEFSLKLQARWQPALCCEQEDTQRGAFGGQRVTGEKIETEKERKGEERNES